MHAFAIAEKGEMGRFDDRSGEWGEFAEERMKIGRLTESEEALARKIVRGLLKRRGSSRRLRAPRRIGANRPSMNGATSFHFSHTNVSKSEKPGRLRAPRSMALHNVPAWMKKAGRAETYQRYIEGIEPRRENALERDSEDREISFGNLGDRREDRDAFWDAAEARERVNGRVQCRLIVELPHELNADQRKAALADFCHGNFGPKRLAWWAVVHRPDPKGDQRNFHAHIVYYDRPGDRGEDGRWRFDSGKGRARFPWGTEAPVSREKRLARRVADMDKKGGAEREVERMRTDLAFVRQWIAEKRQPDRERQVESWRWIKGLRAGFASTMNAHLAKAGIGRRYDPRRYREMGIDAPTARHLGPAQMALERRGIVTGTTSHELMRQGLVEAEAALAVATARHVRSKRYLAAGAALRDGDEDEVLVSRSNAAFTALGEWLAAPEDDDRQQRAREARALADERAAVLFSSALAGFVRARGRQRAEAEKRASDASARRAAARKRLDEAGRGSGIDVDGLLQAALALRTGDRVEWGGPMRQMYADRPDLLEDAALAAVTEIQAAATVRDAGDRKMDDRLRRLGQVVELAEDSGQAIETAKAMRAIWVRQGLAGADEIVRLAEAADRRRIRETSRGPEAGIG